MGRRAWSVSAEALRAQCHALHVVMRQRPVLAERLSGSHNPWGQAAGMIDTWAVLAFFSAPACVDGVKELLGPDVVLWDSQWIGTSTSFLETCDWALSTHWWPVEPATGALVVVDVQGDRCLAVTLGSDADADGDADVGETVRVFARAAQGPLWLARYMPAAGRYVRGKRFPGNRQQMEHCPTINYTNRPIWLVAGEDRAGNDFVTGFNQPVPTWATVVHDEP